MEKNVKFVHADWKDMIGLIERFEKAIEHFGLFFYDDPQTEGSDTFGFIISDKELNVGELQQLSEKYWE